MKKRTGTSRPTFSKKDIFVLLACTAFLLINLGAIGSTGRRRAKEAVCLSNLRQWGAMFQKYTNDNNGYFWDNDGGWGRGKWIIELRPQYETKPHLLRCPEAAKRPPDMTAHYGGPFYTYIMGATGGAAIPEEASYGANCWIYNLRIVIQERPTAWNWRTPHVKAANNIPVFADTMWRGGGPFDGSPGPGQFPERGMPPEYDGQWDGYDKEMKHFCINRHNGAVNHLFMDWSVRKVGLKELWTLKWHREFNTAGPWTTAGGVMPRHWPAWMRNFKDF